MIEVAAFNEVIARTGADAQLALGRRGDTYVSSTRPS
jgi:hypothetical protein